MPAGEHFNLSTVLMQYKIQLRVSPSELQKERKFAVTTIPSSALSLLGSSGVVFSAIITAAWSEISLQLMKERCRGNIERTESSKAKSSTHRAENHGPMNKLIPYIVTKRENFHSSENLYKAEIRYLWTTGGNAYSAECKKHLRQISKSNQ